MRRRTGSRTFSPRPWAIALTVALVAGFVALGSWQLDRAREKRLLVEAFERGDARTVPLTVAPVDELPRYQSISASGRYEPARQVLLDNMPSATGQPGYHVLTPFRRADGGALLLVDRGWVPLGPDRSRLPPVAVDAGPRTVAGRLDGLPAPGIRIGQARAADATGWPLVLNFPVAADLEAALGEPVERRIVLLDASEPHGFERAWRPAVGFPPERHLGYAIQWFALALVLVVAFVATSLQPRTPTADDKR
jgi:surfeit locus 1 family protein